MKIAVEPCSIRPPPRALGGFGEGAVVVAAAIMMTVAVLLTSVASTDASKPRALIFLPWTEDPVASALRAGYRPLRSGVSPSIVVVGPQTDGPGQESWPAGAWLSLNLDGLFGCLDSSPESPR